jgi:hypothetical protein
MENLPHRFWLVLLVFILATTLACSLTDKIPSLGGKTETPSSPTDQPNSTAQPGQPTSQPGDNNLPTNPQNTKGQTTTPAASNNQSATSQPSGSQSATSQPAANQSVDINPKLASLDNYRVSLTITATGKDDQDSDISETFSSLQEVNKKANATHLNNKDEAVTDTTDTTVTDIYVIGDQIYDVDSSSDTPSCTAYGISEESIDDLGGIRPSQMFINVEKDTLISSGETVNGIKADHYSAKNIKMSLGDTTSVSGEVWIAQDGQYIVKFTGKADGNFLLNSNLINGSVTWDYEVTDINQVGDMQAPASCSDSPNAIDANGFPIPDNATDKQILGDFIAYDSPDNADVVRTYYRKQLPDKGWTITKDTEDQDTFIIGITKGSSNLEIMVIPNDPSGCSVVVNTADQ